MTEVKVFVWCSSCEDGIQPQQWKELKKNSDNEIILADMVGVNYVSYELEPKQLENQTIAEFVKGKSCRRCDTKSLKELIK